MIFGLADQDLFLIIFFTLAALVFGLFLGVFFQLLRKKGYSRQRYSAEKELSLRIAEDFKKRVEKEIQKNVGEFKISLQRTSDEIIKSYKTQMEAGTKEIQKVVSALSEFTSQMQNKIVEETKNKTLELNRAAEKEFSKIQQTSLKTFAQISQSTREVLNKKVREAEKEIEDYKKERFKEIDRKIYKMIGEVAKKTLGRTIDLSAHEKLVMESLEKAKKEIF
jgi:F0F1-type ATP synthase membrane subunit b/b'